MPPQQPLDTTWLKALEEALLTATQMPIDAFHTALEIIARWPVISNATRIDFVEDRVNRIPYSEPTPARLPKRRSGPSPAMNACRARQSWQNGPPGPNSTTTRPPVFFTPC
jgi:hypothetical protein